MRLQKDASVKQEALLVTWLIRFGRPSWLPRLLLSLIMVVQSLRWTLI